MSGVARVWLLSGAMVGLALVLHATTVADLGRVPGAPLHLPWWALAGAFFASESLVLRVRYRGQGQAIALNELPFVLGLFFATPTELLLGLLLGSAGALARRRRQSPLQLAFNTSHFFLAAGVGSIAFHEIVFTDPLGPLGWSGALVAAIIVTVVGHAAITSATLLSGSRPEVDRLSQVLSLGVTSAITTTTVALVAVSMLWRDRQSVFLLVVPAAMAAIAYRGYMEHRSKSDTLDLIYESTRMLHRSPEVDSALVGLLTQARTIFRADRAEITLFSIDAEGQAVRTTLGPGAEVEAMARVGVDPGERVFAERLPDGAAAFYPDTGQPVVAALTARGIREAMAVAVRREGRLVATIVVANRIGDASFDHSDLELFEALARNIAVVLESGTLESSLQQLRDLEARLKHQAYHDPLTNLPNRAQFIERAELALDFAASRPDQLAVVLVDLDDFKVVNDSLGHTVGDRLLIELARRIGAVVGPEDAVARLGGDEFAVLLDCFDRSSASEVAGRVLDVIRQPIVVDGTPDALQLRASAGIAMGDSGTRADELLRNADVAMYTAKAAGKNQWRVFSSDMHVAVIERHELITDLQRALERDEFLLHYQPIVSLVTQRVVALEVLVRWMHPRRGLVAPGEFIPLAEETDLILPIGRAVLGKACAQAREWQERFPEHADLAIAVNLSVRQLLQPAFVGDTIQVIAESGVSPETLILEITETELLEDTGASISKLTQLKHLGLRLAMDDFGTGYSSLSFLAELPVDILKIAKPFTDGLGRSERDTAFAQAIIGLGKTVGMQIIAEGVERQDQLDVLRGLGCDMGQGYFFAPAREASYVEHMLRVGGASDDRNIIAFPA